MTRAGVLLTTITVLASLAGIAGAAVAVHRWYCPAEPTPLVVPVPIPQPAPAPDPTPEGPRRPRLPLPWRKPAVGEDGPQ